MPRDPKGKPEKEEELDEVPEPPMRYGWFGTLLIASGRMWREHWKAVTPPFVVLTSLLALITVGIVLVDSAGTRAGAAVYALAQLLWIPLLGSWVVARTSVLIQERTTNLGATYRSVGARVKPQRAHIVASGMLAGALSFFVTVALGDPGTLIALNTMVGPPILIQAIAVEELSFSDGWMRMKELMKGEAARVIVYLIFVGLGVGLVQLVVAGSIGLSLRELNLDSVVFFTANLVVSVVVKTLGLAFMACVGMAAYLELKSRQEARAA